MIHKQTYKVNVSPLEHTGKSKKGKKLILPISILLSLYKSKLGTLFSVPRENFLECKFIFNNSEYLVSAYLKDSTKISKKNKFIRRKMKISHLITFSNFLASM